MNCSFIFTKIAFITWGIGCFCRFAERQADFCLLDKAYEYDPGQTYNLTFEIDDSTFPNGRFGFTTTALDENNLAAGSFTIVNSANTSLQTGNVGGNQRQYMGHRSATNSISTWTYEWTAPANPVGEITFYTYGVAANGNSSTSGDFTYSQTFSMNPLLAPPVAGFEINSPLCSEQAIIFSDTSSGVISSYAWDFGANASPPSANTNGPHSVVFSQAGTQTIQLIVNGPNEADTITQQIEVFAPPTAPAVSFANDSLTAQGESGSYQWFFVQNGGGLDSIPGANDSILAYADFYSLSQNTGIVQVSVQNQAQCATLSESFTLPFPTDIEVPAAIELRLYPNPGRDRLELEFVESGFAERQIRLLSLTGQTLREARINQSQVSINTADLAPGLYLVEVREGEKQISLKWRKE
ncbi:MAG: choice-of-anchor V domain-containing protein [Bacteroidota bacterium]